MEDRFTIPQVPYDIFIYGRGYLSYMTEDEIGDLYQQFISSSSQTRSYSRYADNGAYFQDIESIRDNEDNMRKIEYFLKKRSESK